MTTAAGNLHRARAEIVRLLQSMDHRYLREWHQLSHSKPALFRSFTQFRVTTRRMVPLDATGNQGPPLLCARKTAHFPARALAPRLAQHGTHHDLRPLHVRTRTRTHISRPYDPHRARTRACADMLRTRDPGAVPGSLHVCTHARSILWPASRFRFEI